MFKNIYNPYFTYYYPVPRVMDHCHVLHTHATPQYPIYVMSCEGVFHSRIIFGLFQPPWVI